ncbi:S8 family peptidase [Cyanothece sp. BG0011]|uniref:S8 family peptidase n=1 Tax=Cyanothece sp. BG0011 TaxID=2082950 RepID=UPI000D1F95CC|nr:S8 family peptidase [Cyanothece sp. BG0011]
MVKSSRKLPHLYLRNNGKKVNYTSTFSGGRKISPPYRNRKEHAEKLQRQIGEAIEKARQQLESRLSEIAVGKPGFYLEFEVTKDQANAFESLADKRKKLELVSVKSSLEQEDIVKATVFVPESATDFFQEKVEQYLNENNKPTKKLNEKNLTIVTLLFLINTELDKFIFLLLLLPFRPKNEKLISRVETVEIGTAKSLFTDSLDLFPQNEQAIWWEVWLRRDQLENFQTITQRLEITTKSEIKFPERIVVLAMANVEAIEQVIKNSDTIAELRIAKDTPSFFLEMGLIEQQQWVRDLENRLESLRYDIDIRDNAVAVCLLDTGVNGTHQLIKRGLDIADLYTCDPNWETNDHHGHGTQMAGLVLYSDLFEALTSSEYITLAHCLESVKILPPVGENDPELYGAITEQGVSLPEIQNPKRKRIFSMAITSPKPSPNYGTPSSWSAAIDQLCFGEDNYKRLMIISAGNIRDDIYTSDYLNINDVNTVENPAQAWNALIVGAYTEKVNITHPDFQGWQAVAPSGDLSPRSRTSVTWDSQWPIRPDVVFEGGNCASDGENAAQNIDDLSILTTYHRPEKRLFERMSDTSCATALASYMAAKILAEKPNYWPETIRALIVHSAEWTPAMQEYLKSASSQRKKTSIIRRYGYGVPNLERALRSTNNDLTLIIEDQVKPFVKGSSKIKTNEMNFHTLPWPTEELEKLGESIVELKVTLSYFIEPNPGERGWTKKHRYASHGLRFEVKRPLESNTQFEKRINKAMREEDEKISSSGENDNWFLGANLRNKGSLHSDRWTGTAVELAERKMIGVFPVGGWWKEKKYLERYDQTVRYSLIITIRVPEIEIECDLYTPVSDQIKASQEIKNKQDISTATEIEN